MYTNKAPPYSKAELRFKVQLSTLKKIDPETYKNPPYLAEFLFILEKSNDTTESGMSVWAKIAPPYYSLIVIELLLNSEFVIDIFWNCEIRKAPP